MGSMAMQRDALMPRSPGGTGPGLVLALLVHGLLLLALAVGVSWRASEPEAVSAELWAAVPEVAAPKAVEPEPVPVPKPEPPPPPKPAARAEPEPDAQIAIEKQKREERERKQEEERKLAEKRKQEEAEKLAAEKRKQEQEDKRKRLLEEQKLAALREQNLKRMLGQAGATGAPTSTGTAARDAGPSASYAGRIKARIKPNITFADTIDGNPEASVEVRLSPDGTIVGKKLVKSSGSAAWDEAVLRAIDKTEVLPRDIDGRVPSPMLITFKPRD